MRAARLAAPGRVEIVECETPTPGQDEVVVRVLACGVCGSDQNPWRGVPGIEYPLPPGLPGHEVWGELAALGPGVGDALAVGQFVTGLMQAGYAEYTVARAADVCALPEALRGAPVLGEPLACAANVVRRIARGREDRIAFVGFGYIAAIVAQLLFAERPGRWIAISRRPGSRDLALSLGAEAAYAFDDVPQPMWDGFPIVIEAAGVQQALDYATWLTAYGGRLVIVGYHADGPRTINLQSWNWKGIDVINAHERQPEVYVRGLREGLALVEQHRIDLNRLVSHHWPLDRLADALATAEARPPDYVKGVILPWPG